MELSIVIPVYKSEKIILPLVSQIEENTRFVEGDRELILVNDCSPDRSWEQILEAANKFDFVKGINLRQNTGQHNAIMAGLNHAYGNVIVMMDDDLQHSPIYIKQLYDKIKSGSDVCYTKYRKTHHALWKRFGSRLNDIIAGILLKKPKHLYLSSFKAIGKDIRNELIKYDGPFTYIDGLILLSTNNIASIEIEHFERYEGKGNYRFIKSMVLWFKMSTGFSLLPLRIATVFGLGFSILTFIMALYYFIIWMITPNVPPGWTTLILVVLFLGGVQLFSIGIIGEYVGRTYFRINNKPQYVIKSTTNFNNSSQTNSDT